MSVDFDRMAAHLPADQRKQLSRQYRRGAKNDTTAFLSGFFLGIFGAHHFYLGEWVRGFAHLVIPVAVAAAILIGIAAGLPSLPIAIIVAALLLVAVIWEIVDLFKIDDNVHGRNLKLAESLVGAGALADNSVLTDAVSRLDSAVTGAAVAGVAAAGVASAAGTAGATGAMGGISAEDVSAARALAGDHSGAIMEEFDSSTTKYISDDPNATSPGAPGSWSETMATAPAASAADPSAGDTLDMPAPEYVTHTHTETYNSVTDSYQFDRSPDSTQPMAIPTAADPDATWPNRLPEGVAAGAMMAGASGVPGAGDSPLVVDASTTQRDMTDAHPYAQHGGLIADVEANPTQPVYVELPPESEAAGGEAARFGLMGAAGAAAGAGAAYLATHADEPPAPPVVADTPAAAPETMPEAAPTSGPLLKRIRMKRQIVVDGQVVREEVVEKLVPVDTDTSSLVAAMDTELGHASKEEIAHMANLDPDASLDVRQRMDTAPQTPPSGEE